MVSPLSARLLGVSAVQQTTQTLQLPHVHDDRDSAESLSNSSNSKQSGNSGARSTSYHQKRAFGVGTTTADPTSKSISGYSADREGAVVPEESPPGVVNVHQRYNGSGSGSGANSVTSVEREEREKFIMNNCPKRRKKNEVAFAASTVEADLTRAGMTMTTLNVATMNDDGGIVTTKDGTSISLTGVKLVRSAHVAGPFILPTSSSLSPSLLATTSDYVALIQSVHDLYPYEKTSMVNSCAKSGCVDITTTTTTTTKAPRRTQHIKQFQVAQAPARHQRQGTIVAGNDITSDNCSVTSSVSDTESDSFSDNGNMTSASGSSGNGDKTALVGSTTSSQDSRRSVPSSLGHAHRRSVGIRNSSSASTSSRGSTSNNQKVRTLVIPPLLDNSSGAQANPYRVTDIVSPCNVISCPTNAVTMTEMLQLSCEARLVTQSAAPFSVIYANAAFLRMACKDGTKSVIGTPFFSLLDNDTTPSDLSLMDCMVSSSMGIDTKLSITKGDLNEHEIQSSTKTNIDDDKVDVDMVKNRNKLVECSICVSPIVARKATNREVTSVTHFAISLHQSGMCNDGISIGSASKSPIHNTLGASDTMPMEVMG